MLEVCVADAILSTRIERSGRPSVKIPFYFDYACPWAYLASCRAESYFQDLGAEIDFRPVRLADLAEIGAQLIQRGKFE